MLDIPWGLHAPFNTTPVSVCPIRRIPRVKKNLTPVLQTISPKQPLHHTPTPLSKHALNTSIKQIPQHLDSSTIATQLMNYLLLLASSTSDYCLCIIYTCTFNSSWQALALASLNCIRHMGRNLRSLRFVSTASKAKYFEHFMINKTTTHSTYYRYTTIWGLP